MEPTLGRRVRALALPAIGISLLQTAVLVVDRAMLGHHAESSLAAMQIAGPLEWSLWSIFAAFEVGTIARVGLHVGAGDRERARAAAWLSLAVALIAGLVLTVATPIVLPFLHLVFSTAGPEVISEATGYLRYALAASPIVFIAAAAFVTLQASGDTRTPLVIGIASNAFHIALNRVLIGGGLGFPAMGARGAGISTSLTFLIEAILGLAVLSSTKRNVSLRARPQDREKKLELRDEFRSMRTIALPAVLERVLYHLGFTAFVLLIVRLGDQAMAANQALIGLEAVCFNSAEGFAIAAAALVAQELGAGRPAEARRAAGIAQRDGVLALSLLGLTCWAFRAPLLAIFSTDAPTLALGARTMPILALAQPFMATGIVLAQALRGAGKTRTVLGVSAIGAIGVRLACTWFFAFGLGLGLVGVWLGSTCDWAARSAILLTMRYRGQMFKKTTASLSSEG